MSDVIIDIIKKITDTIENGMVGFEQLVKFVVELVDTIMLDMMPEISNFMDIIMYILPIIMMGFITMKITKNIIQ